MSGNVNAILQINGGSSAPSNNLLERELYITNDGWLYVGNSTANSAGDVIESRSPQRVLALTKYLLHPQGLYAFDNDSNTVTLGGIFVSKNADGSFLLKGLVSGNTHKSKIQSVALSDCVLTGNTKLNGGHIYGGTELENVNINGASRFVVTNACYGTGNPSSVIKNPVAGQVYFKLST